MEQNRALESNISNRIITSLANWNEQVGHYTTNQV